MNEALRRSTPQCDQDTRLCCDDVASLCLPSRLISRVMLPVLYQLCVFLSPIVSWHSVMISETDVSQGQSNSRVGRNGMRRMFIIGTLQ